MLTLVSNIQDFSCILNLIIKFLEICDGQVLVTMVILKLVQAEDFLVINHNYEHCNFKGTILIKTENLFMP